MNATPQKKPTVWNALLGIFFLMLGAYCVWVARLDAARHIIRHGSYKTGYAPIYPWQDLGFGIGLRSVHFQHILENKPATDWFEVLSENYMDTGGRPLHVLDQVAERYPVVLHGVSLSVGSKDPVNFEYLKKLKTLRIMGSDLSGADFAVLAPLTGLKELNVYTSKVNEKSLAALKKSLPKLQVTK